MKRAALLFLVLGLCAAAFWVIRRGGGSARRAPPSSGEVGEAPEPLAYPSDPVAFVAWLKDADAAALKEAGESLSLPGERSDALLRAVVEALRGDWSDSPWAEDFFAGVGARAVPFLEARFLRPDPGCRVAAWLAFRLADIDERQRFLLVCLGHPEEDMQEVAAGCIASAFEGEDPPRLVATPELRAAICRSLAKAPQLFSESTETNLYSGPVPFSEQLCDALLATLAGAPDQLSVLAADEAPEVRLGAARAIGELAVRVGDQEATEKPDATEEERAEREHDAALARAALTAATVLIADPDARVRHAAVRSMGALAVRNVAVPRDLVLQRLVDASETPEVRAAAAGALVYMEPNPTGDLARYLDDSNPTVRAAVIDAVYWNPPPELEPKLLASLDHEDAHLRAVAAEALHRYAREPGSPCRRRLADGLGDPSEAVRLACAESLQCRGVQPVEALPYLARWLTQGSEDEREAALELVQFLGEKAAPLEQAILSVAVQPEVANRARYIEALAWIPGADERVFETAMRASTEHDPHLRQAGVLVLGKRFADRATAREVVIRALSDKDEWVNEAAAMCLAEHGLETPAVLRWCVQMIEDGHDWRQKTALELLGGYGVQAREAVPSVLRLVEGPYDPVTGKEAITTLVKLKDLATETVPRLVELAAEGNWTALATLEALGPAAEPHLSNAVARLDPARQDAFSKARLAFREASKAK